MHTYNNINNTTDNIEFPIIDKELITAFHKVFPNAIPSHKMDDYEQGKMAGHSEVIDRLQAEYNIQQEELEEKAKQ